MAGGGLLGLPCVAAFWHSAPHPKATFGLQARSTWLTTLRGRDAPYRRSLQSALLDQAWPTQACLLLLPNLPVAPNWSGLAPLRSGAGPAPFRGLRW